MSEDNTVSFRLCDQGSSDRDVLLSAQSKFLLGAGGMSCQHVSIFFFFTMLITAKRRQTFITETCVRWAVCVYECVRVSGKQWAVWVWFLCTRVIWLNLCFYGLLVEFDVRKMDTSSNYFIVMTDKFCYDCFFLSIKQYIFVAKLHALRQQLSLLPFVIHHIPDYRYFYRSPFCKLWYIVGCISIKKMLCFVVDIPCFHFDFSFSQTPYCI